MVAEGVETEEQHELLARYGCDEMQGYLYSKPIPVADFEGLLQMTSFSA
ncbi:EAL domain-containing protein [Alicyclobacillus cycloheptanicus]|nr:EAL domain-containing protein [Alicyclobacillus cycloheptanicus]